MLTPWAAFRFFIWRTNFFLDELKLGGYGKNEVLEILTKSSSIFDIEFVKIQLFLDFLAYSDQYVSYEHEMTFVTKPESFK